jgi:hypothetical protein
MVTPAQTCATACSCIEFRWHMRTLRNSLVVAFQKLRMRAAAVGTMYSRNPSDPPGLMAIAAKELCCLAVTAWEPPSGLWPAPYSRQPGLSVNQAKPRMLELYGPVKWAASGLLPRNVIGQSFYFIIAQFLGDLVHDAIWAVRAVILSEIDQLPANVILLLATNYREH